MKEKYPHKTKLSCTQFIGQPYLYNVGETLLEQNAILLPQVFEKTYRDVYNYFTRHGTTTWPTHFKETLEKGMLGYNGVESVYT